MAMPKSVRRTRRSSRTMSTAAMTMMSTCRGVMVRPATSQRVMGMRFGKCRGCGPRSPRVRYFQEQPHSQGGDDRRDPGGLAQGAVGQAFDAHPQKRRQDHTEGQGPQEDQHQGQLERAAPAGRRPRPG